MRYAQYGPHGDLVTLQEFIEREGKTSHKHAGPDGKKGWSVEPLCPDCGEKVFVWDALGALHFKAVSGEVGKLHRLPGFHHYQGGAGDNCHLSYAHPRYENLYSHTKLDERERRRNEEVLLDPKMAAANERMLHFLMLRLTGQNEMSPENRRLVASITKQRLLDLAGLADNPWVLPYMQALYIAERPRLNHKNQLRMAIYRAKGWQELKFTDMGGDQRIMRVPIGLELCFSYSRTGKVVPMRPRGKSSIVFEVSRQFAHNIVRDALLHDRREEEEQRRMTMPHPSGLQAYNRPKKWPSAKRATGPQQGKLGL